MKGKVYFIGAGPGDPELLTLKAKRLLEAADLVIYTGSLLGVGLVARARPTAVVRDSAELYLEQIVAMMVEAARRGQLVARLHSGDPTVFGAIHEQLVALERAGVPFEIVPGVSSVFAAAAALGAELTVPEVAQTVILTRTEGRTPMPPGEQLEALARHGATMALYLSAALIGKAARALMAGYPADTPAAVVADASMPSQRIVTGPLSEIAERARSAGIKAQAMVLVGRALDPEIRRTEAGRRSRLYDPGFSHSFRRGATTHE
jgi:precorrin-4/cobalt-precorrin-4 C11-methyltransferase